MDESLKSTKRFRARARVWLILVGCSFWLLLSCGGGEEELEPVSGAASLDADLLFEEPRAPPRTQPPPEDALDAAETGGPGGVALALEQGEADPCAPLIEAAVSEVPSFFLDEAGFSIQGPGSLLPALPSAHFCPFGAHRDKVNAVRFSPDGFYAASAGADRRVQVWQLDDKDPIYELGTFRSEPLALAFSLDGTLLAIGQKDGRIAFIETESGTILGIFSGHAKAIYTLAFSPDGLYLASGSGDGTIRLWSLEEQGQVRILTGGQGSVLSLDFSPDGLLLASGWADGGLRVWDRGSGTLYRQFDYHQERISAVAFSPDGEVLAAASWDKRISLWRLASSEQIHLLEGHTGWISDITFTHEGDELISAGWDRTVRVWRATSGKALHILRGHAYHVRAVSWNALVPLVLSGGGDNQLYLWFLPPTRVQNHAPDSEFRRRLRDKTAAFLFVPEVPLPDLPEAEGLEREPFENNQAYASRVLDNLAQRTEAQEELLENYEEEVEEREDLIEERRDQIDEARPRLVAEAYSEAYGTPTLKPLRDERGLPAYNFEVAQLFAQLSWSRTSRTQQVIILVEPDFAEELFYGLEQNEILFSIFYQLDSQNIPIPYALGIDGEPPAFNLIFP